MEAVLGYSMSIKLILFFFEIYSDHISVALSKPYYCKEQCSEWCWGWPSRLMWVVLLSIPVTSLCFLYDVERVGVA